MNRWLAALAVVTLGWAVTPGAVPVYDGVGTPDDPCRPLGTASSAQQVVQVGPASSSALSLRTAETGPQAIVDAGAGALRAASVRPSTVSVTPVPAGTAPAQGALDSVVYRIAATGGATVPPTAQGFLFLRASVMTQPDPVIVHRDLPTSAWTVLHTARPGRDVLSVPFRALGDYAVVRLPGSKPLSAGGLSGTRLLLLAGGVLVLLALAVFALRRPHGDDDRDLTRRPH